MQLSKLLACVIFLNIFLARKCIIWQKYDSFFRNENIKMFRALYYLSSINIWPKVLYIIHLAQVGNSSSVLDGTDRRLQHLHTSADFCCDVFLQAYIKNTLFCTSVKTEKKIKCRETHSHTECNNVQCCCPHYESFNQFLSK